MNQSGPGASVPSVADPRRRFFAWRTLHPREAEDPGLVWAEAWRQAYWAGLKENAQLGVQLLGVVERIQALEQQLRDLQMNDEVDREIAESSAYWKTEVEA